MQSRRLLCAMTGREVFRYAGRVSIDGRRYTLLSVHPSADVVTLMREGGDVRELFQCPPDFIRCEIKTLDFSRAKF